MTSYRFFTIELREDAVVVRAVDSYLQGQVMAELIKLELLQIVDTSAQRDLVIDFQIVKLISSSVISSLLNVKTRLTALHRSLKLTGMSDALRHVFKTLNMDGTVFSIYPSLDAALSTDNRTTYYYDVSGEPCPPDEENA